MARVKKTKQAVPIEFQIFYEKLDRIIGLLAANLHKEKSIGEKAFILSKLGFNNKRIAELLGTTLGTVKIRLHEYRKKMGQRKIKKKAMEAEQAEIKRLRHK